MDSARTNKRRRTSSSSASSLGSSAAGGPSPSAYPYSGVRGSPPYGSTNKPSSSSSRFYPHPPPSVSFHSQQSSHARQDEPYSARSPSASFHNHHHSHYTLLSHSYSPYSSSLFNPHSRPPLQANTGSLDTPSRSASRGEEGSFSASARSPLPISKDSPVTPPTVMARDDSAFKANRKDTSNEKPRGGQACLECRLAKVRCLPSNGSENCQRCQRFKFDCLFVQHKRGRKPKSKLQGRDLTLLAEAASATPASTVNAAAPVNGWNGASPASAPVTNGKARADRRSTATESPLDPNLMGETTMSSPSSSTLRARFTNDSAYDPKKMSGVDVGRMTLAIQQAMRSQGRQRGAPYTLVTTNDDPTVDNSESSSEQGTPIPTDATTSINESFELIAEQPLTLRVMLKRFEVAENPTYDTPRTVHDDRITIGAQQRELHLNDPVTTNVLSETAARALFDLFMHHANSWSQVFDTALQTHDWVRKRSSFLYTTLMYVASRFCRMPTAQHLIVKKQRGESVSESEWDIAYPPGCLEKTAEEAGEHASQIRKVLYAQARDHAARAFVDGDRTVACCQAFFILASWKTLDDGLSVIQVGYAFRLAMDIQLHAEMPECVKPDQASLDQAGRQRYEAVQRRFRNRQRTFMMLFVQDKSQQIANKISTGSISADNSLIRSCQTWWRAAGSIPGDAFVCANVDLRRLQGKYVDLMERIETLATPITDGPSVVLPAFLNDIAEWYDRWADALDLTADFDVLPYLEDADINKRRCQKTTLSLWKDNIKTYVSSLALKYSLKQAALREHQEMVRSQRRSATLSTDGQSIRSQEPGVVNLMSMPAFWPCVEGARGVLEAINKLPADRLVTTPDATVLQTTHAAVLLCSLATVKSQPPLGPGYLKTTIQLIDQTSAAFRNAFISKDDTVYHIALYLESLLRPQNAAEKPQELKTISAPIGYLYGLGETPRWSEEKSNLFFNVNQGLDAGSNAMAATAASVTPQMNIGNLTWPNTPTWNANDSLNWNSLIFNQPSVQGQEETDETLQMLLRFLDG